MNSHDIWLQYRYAINAPPVEHCASNSTLLCTPAQDIFLFQHLSEKQIADVVRVISREHVEKGEVVIKQGDEGEKFYIVDAGEFDVRCFVLMLSPP